jgi:hypothetical protein
VSVDVSTPEARLQRVLEDLSELRAEWERLGKPSVAQGSSGGVIPHPLIGMIRRAESLAFKMQRRIDGARVGRPRGSASAPDRVA